MFGLFSKRDKQLEAIVYQIKVDLSNNYKDNAIEGIEKLAKLIDEKKAAGTLKDASFYENALEEFREDVKNFKRTY
ncbi:MAG: hypothetical protein J5517_00070 [Eubacterium sp.]|nr:hypothetical protein [Eubacterium sp.]